MDAAQNTIDGDADEISMKDAAEKLRDSFDEMSSLTEELSGTMTEVADGFASFSDSTRRLQERRSERIEPTASGSSHAIADD